MATTCRVCGRSGEWISGYMRVCAECLRERPDESLPLAIDAHKRSREAFGLPGEPPRDEGGIPCKVCGNECVIGEGSIGYCGLRGFRDGRLYQLASADKALLHHYLDAHITNCCNAWFCPGGNGYGYPRYAVKRGPEYGYYNLALFFYACSFDCLFCQNWSHKILDKADVATKSEIVSLTLSDYRISCWCWFGGSPEPQLPFAISSSKEALEGKPRHRVLRICFEWNGTGNRGLVRKAAELALVSGGNVKFDLKASSPAIHIALTGRDNKRVLENFELIYEEFYRERADLPVLGATTLLVPHYIDEIEIEGIAKFIADLDDGIPYNLLAFHPDFRMIDMPSTSREQAMRCYKAARRYLKNVNISNMRLLGYSKDTYTWGLAHRGS